MNSQYTTLRKKKASGIQKAHRSFKASETSKSMNWRGKINADIFSGTWTPS